MCGVYGAGSSCRYGARRGLARLVAGSTCRSSTRRGACRLCRLSTLPFACFPAPIPLPALAERSSRREGGDFCYLMQGASPLASPGLAGRGTGSAGVGGTRRGAFPVGRRFCLPFRHPAGTCFLGRLSTLPFAYFPAPIPPTPFPGGKGEIFVILLQGASPLASPGAGGARHWLGFEETIRFGIAGGRRLQLQSITNSRKVLGGLGAFFKKPPTFLRSPVPSFSRS